MPLWRFTIDVDDPDDVLTPDERMEMYADGLSAIRIAIPREKAPVAKTHQVVEFPIHAHVGTCQFCAKLYSQPETIHRDQGTTTQAS